MAIIQDSRAQPLFFFLAKSDITRAVLRDPFPPIPLTTQAHTQKVHIVFFWWGQSVRPSKASHFTAPYLKSENSAANEWQVGMGVL